MRDSVQSVNFGVDLKPFGATGMKTVARREVQFSSVLKKSDFILQRTREISTEVYWVADGVRCYAVQLNSKCHSVVMCHIVFCLLSGPWFACPSAPKRTGCKTNSQHIQRESKQTQTWQERQRSIENQDVNYSCVTIHLQTLWTSNQFLQQQELCGICFLVWRKLKPGCFLL